MTKAGLEAASEGKGESFLMISQIEYFGLLSSATEIIKQEFLIRASECGCAEATYLRAIRNNDNREESNRLLEIAIEQGSTEARSLKTFEDIYETCSVS